ncbi:MAG: DUF799 domain-containing protein [Gammaproteobacteria bacterium]|nr:DUF799 domain-containing protein [Gammaproteobacteria bacterium]
MSVLRSGAAGLVLLGSVLATGCASTPKSYDYTAFKQSRPRSILVLPPTNGTPEVTASYGMLSQMTLPLAESGYYVLPVTLVDETFRQNGLTQPEDIAALPLTKLEEIFGADAALYVNITKYGTVYVLLNSESVVTAEARLIDLRSGATLWEGSASASSAESRGATSGGLVGLLVAAVVNQIADNLADASHRVAATTSQRLLSAGQPGGILYGPRSPKYQTQ